MKKIKPRILFVLAVLFCSCADSGTPRNGEILHREKNGDWTLRLTSSISIKNVRMDKDIKPIGQVIDVESFDYLERFEADAKKIANEDYIVNLRRVYFKDKRYLYVLKKSKIPKLEVLCASDAYEILGGMYVRVGDDIFWEGEKLDGVDVKSFLVNHVLKNKKERPTSVGLDKFRIYLGPRPMTQKSFEEFFWETKDELRAFYFPKK